MLTEKGKSIYEDAIKFGIEENYEPYVGTFGFTENELFSNMNNILMFIEAYKSEYFLTFEDNDGCQCGRNWWLVPYNMVG